MRQNDLPDRPAVEAEDRGLLDRDRPRPDAESPRLTPHLKGGDPDKRGSKKSDHERQPWQPDPARIRRPGSVL